MQKTNKKKRAQRTGTNLTKAAHQYQYVLGERTLIEYWPIQTECQTETYQPTCLGIEELKAKYELFGCPL